MEPGLDPSVAGTRIGRLHEAVVGDDLGVVDGLLSVTYCEIIYVYFIK